MIRHRLEAYATLKLPRGFRRSVDVPGDDFDEFFRRLFFRMPKLLNAALR
jgi:hypothetical protein